MLVLVVGVGPSAALAVGAAGSVSASSGEAGSGDDAVVYSASAWWPLGLRSDFAWQTVRRQLQGEMRFRVRVSAIVGDPTEAGADRTAPRAKREMQDTGRGGSGAIRAGNGRLAAHDGPWHTHAQHVSHPAMRAGRLRRR